MRSRLQYDHGYSCGYGRGCGYSSGRDSVTVTATVTVTVQESVLGLGLGLGFGLGLGLHGVDPGGECGSRGIFGEQLLSGPHASIWVRVVMVRIRVRVEESLLCS